MYQQEEKEAEEAYEDPGDDEFVDDTENMWALMEFGEEDQEDSDLEEGQVEGFWSMINSEKVDKISPSVAIQKLGDVEIDATKSTSLWQVIKKNHVKKLRHGHGAMQRVSAYY